VIYKARYGEGQLYARPQAMFLEHVEKPELGYSGPRFTRVEGDA